MGRGLPRVREAIVVEGRYDKNTLSQVVDALILETSGFGIFKDEERLALLRRLAAERGLLVLTDSDGAGFVIRNYLKGAVDPSQVKHAYIPDRPGKEKRKRAPGREGKLGVEGMSAEVLLEALRRGGATFLDVEAASNLSRRPITKTDLYLAGLSGTAAAAENRRALLRKLDLPEHMTANALLEALNALYGYDWFAELVGGLGEREAAGWKRRL